MGAGQEGALMGGVEDAAQAHVAELGHTIQDKDILRLDVKVDYRLGGHLGAIGERGVIERELSQVRSMDWRSE